MAMALMEMAVSIVCGGNRSKVTNQWQLPSQTVVLHSVTSNYMYLLMVANRGLNIENTAND